MDFNIGAALWFAARGQGRLLQLQPRAQPRAQPAPFPSSSSSSVSSSTLLRYGAAADGSATQSGGDDDATRAPPLPATPALHPLATATTTTTTTTDASATANAVAVCCRGIGCRRRQASGCASGAAPAAGAAGAPLALLQQLQRLRRPQQKKSDDEEAAAAAAAVCSDAQAPMDIKDEEGGRDGGAAKQQKGRRSKFVLDAAGVEAQLAKDGLVDTARALTRATTAANDDSDDNDAYEYDVSCLYCPAHGSLSSKSQRKRNASASGGAEERPKTDGATEAEEAGAEAVPPPSSHYYYDNYNSYSARCTARVLLSGAGADEQLAGYSRHRGVWSRGGAAALAAELATAMGRIGCRNLGRDDRCVGDHGRAALPVPRRRRGGAARL